MMKCSKIIALSTLIKDTLDFHHEHKRFSRLTVKVFEVAVDTTKLEVLRSYLDKAKEA